MTKRKQTHNEYPGSSFNRYRDTDQPTKPESSRRKWGKRMLVGLVAAGALFGTAEGIAASNESEHKEAVAVGEKFKKTLQPAAESIAENAMAEYKGSKDKNKGYIVEDPDDSTKHTISFSGTLENGTFYTLRATVGEDTKGNVDPSKVEWAQIAKTDRDNMQTKTVTIGIEEDAMNGESQWVGSSGLKTAGMDSMAYTSKYFGGHYESLEDNLDSASKIAKDVNKELDELGLGHRGSGASVSQRY